MIKRYLTVGLAMVWLVGKAESVKVVYHILSEDGNPVTNAVVKTTTERDRLNMSCNGSCLACAAFLLGTCVICALSMKNGLCLIQHKL